MLILPSQGLIDMSLKVWRKDWYKRSNKLIITSSSVQNKLKLHSLLITWSSCVTLLSHWRRNIVMNSSKYSTECSKLLQDTILWWKDYHPPWLSLMLSLDGPRSYQHPLKDGKNPNLLMTDWLDYRWDILVSKTALQMTFISNKTKQSFLQGLTWVESQLISEQLVCAVTWPILVCLFLLQHFNVPSLTLLFAE